MTAADRYVFIKSAAVFCEPCTAERAAVVMRRAIESLLGLGLDFDEAADRAIFDGGDPSPIQWSKRPVFLSGPMTSYAVLVDHYWRAEAKYHYLVISLDQDFPEGELEREWTSLTEWSEHIARDLMPDFAFAWGTPSDWNEKVIPYESLRSHALPKTLLPWTVLGAESLDQAARKQIEHLPAHKSRALGSAWLVQAVARPGVRPEPTFVETLPTIGDMVYLDPLVE